MLESIDQQLFEVINSGLSNSLFDQIVPYFRNKYFWTPVYLGIVIWLLYKYGKAGGWIIICTVAAIAISDSVNSKILKALFERPRPCHSLEGDAINLLVDCGGGFSFPSSHAANHFAIAGVLGLLFYKQSRLATLLLFGWAALVAFSQVYVGVHYPFDVTMGGLFGLSVGILLAFICKQKLSTPLQSVR